MYNVQLQFITIDKSDRTGDFKYWANCQTKSPLDIW